MAGEGGRGAEAVVPSSSDAAAAQQEAAKPGRNDAHNAVQSSGQDTAEKIKREEIARRAKEAMAQLLEGPRGVCPVSFSGTDGGAGLNYSRLHAGPDLETLSTVSWNRLGLSVASSNELRELRYGFESVCARLSLHRDECRADENSAGKA